MLLLLALVLYFLKKADRSHFTMRNSMKLAGSGLFISWNYILSLCLESLETLSGAEEVCHVQ